MAKKTVNKSSKQTNTTLPTIKTRTQKKSATSQPASGHPVAVAQTAIAGADNSTTSTSSDKPAPRSSAWRRLGRSIASRAMRSSLPEILLVATLAMARYLTNSDFSYPSEIILDIVLLAVVVSVLTYLFRLLLRRWLPAHVAGLFITYVCFNFSTAFPSLEHVADRLIPSAATAFTKSVLTLLFLAVVFAAVAHIIDRLVRSRRQLKNIPVLQIIVFVVGFVFITELGKVGLRVWTIKSDLAYKQPALDLSQDKSKATGAKPNVYYLLFDRYANATTLKDDYNFDNSSLLNNLSDQGLTTRQDAYANYPFTMMSVSSTLAMGYHAKIGTEFKNDSKHFQTGFPYRTILDNPPVAQALKANGYNYNQVSSWWDFTRNVPAANDEPTESFRLRMFGKNFWLSDLQRDIVNKSILGPLVRKGITINKTAIIKYQLDRNPVENFNAQLAAIKQIAQDSKTQKQPQFTFAHVLSPHDPYIFDKNGDTPSYDQNRTDSGVDETVKYTNQVSYINTRIESVIANIRKNDPGAAIVMQADEGPYPKQFRGTLSPTHLYNPINLPLQQQRQKFGVLASYYMPGVSSQGVSSGITSSVNAFRFVLSHYLGYDLPNLPDCQFTSGDKYTLYTYQLVTGSLKGTVNPPACEQYRYAK